MDKQETRERLTAKANTFLSSLSDNINGSNWHINSKTTISIDADDIEKSYISVKFKISKRLVRQLEEIPGQQKIDKIGGD